MDENKSIFDYFNKKLNGDLSLELGFHFAEPNSLPKYQPMESKSVVM
jgi:hypothetical protein